MVFHVPSLHYVVWILTFALLENLLYTVGHGLHPITLH